MLPYPKISGNTQIVVFTDALREAEARILDIHDIGVIELRAGM